MRSTILFLIGLAVIYSVFFKVYPINPGLAGIAAMLTGWTMGLTVKALRKSGVKI